MSNRFYTRQLDHQLLAQLKVKRDEICSLAPQNIGFLTPWYKRLTSPLKISPWRIFLPLSFLLSFLGQFFLGSRSIKVVSVLQAAF